MYLQKYLEAHTLNLLACAIMQLQPHLQQGSHTFVMLYAVHSTSSLEDSSFQKISFFIVVCQQRKLAVILTLQEE